jgi:uncharacterized protein YjbI with pentapeptide repeats
MRKLVQSQEIDRLRAAKTPEERQSILDSMQASGLLQGANLSGANLPGVYLRLTIREGKGIEANLQGAHLRKANLQGAHLSGANLRGANLNRANLQGATLCGANLILAHLIKANLEGADLRVATPQGANLTEANLKEANLRFADLQGARLDRAILQGADSLFLTSLQGASLWETDLQGANLAGAYLLETKRLTVEQLRQAESIAGAILPDGTRLPYGDTWREAFEVWCETVETDEEGYIIPANDDE